MDRPTHYDVTTFGGFSSAKALGVTFTKAFLACLWSPYVIGQTIIFLPCDFYLSSFFLLSFFLA